MENGQVPFNVLSDTYRLWCPIEDNDLMKSVDVDENGDYIVAGVMSSDDLDEEGDRINPEGMDCSYFLKKGWVKYEHGNNPNQFIGEPLEVRVGQFTHPVLKKSVDGIYVKSRLFANRELARQAVRAIEDLQKSNTSRRMGWSIEGGVKERCRKTGKVLKSVLRNVVLTMNPVNTMTWAELSKSFAKDHAIEIDMELDKSMDTAAIAEITPQSVESGVKEPNEPDLGAFVTRLFRDFLKAHGLRKSFYVQSSGEIGLTAFSFAIKDGATYDQACEFASYMADKRSIFKSLFWKDGGDRMPNQASLANLLDTELEELRKSLESDEDDDFEGEDEDELQKSQNADDEGDEGEDDEGEDEGYDEGDDDEDEDDMEKSIGYMEQSIGSNLRKSLTDEHGMGQAFEVSEWLSALTDELGFGMEGMQKSLSQVANQQQTMLKSLSSMVQVVQEMALKVEGLESENQELRKSLGDVLDRPVGRKSVVNQREVQTLSKSLDAPKPKQLTRAYVTDELLKSFNKNELDYKEVLRFDAGVPLEKLNLPESLKQSFGL